MCGRDAGHAESGSGVQVFPLAQRSFFSANSSHHEQVEELRGDTGSVPHGRQDRIDTDQAAGALNLVPAIGKQLETLLDQGLNSKQDDGRNDHLICH